MMLVLFFFFVFCLYRHLKFVNLCIKGKGLVFGWYVEKVILTPVQTHSNRLKSPVFSLEKIAGFCCRITDQDSECYVGMEEHIESVNLCEL